MERSHVRVASDRLAPKRAAKRPAARQPPLPDAEIVYGEVSFEPPLHHSITSSARASNDGGTSMPSAFAVLRLMTNSNLVGCTTGRSPGFSPFRMRPT